LSGRAAAVLRADTSIANAAHGRTRTPFAWSERALLWGLLVILPMFRRLDQFVVRQGQSSGEATTTATTAESLSFEAVGSCVGQFRSLCDIVALSSRLSAIARCDD
jgi:hypothetical protein